MNKSGIKAVFALILVAILITQSNIPIVPLLIADSTRFTTYAASASNSIKLNYKTLTLEEGESKSLKVVITISSIINEKATWSSSNNNIATVSSSGKVKAIKAGKAIISVKSVNGIKASCIVKVTSNEKVALDVSKDNALADEADAISETGNAEAENDITVNIKPEEQRRSAYVCNTSGAGVFVRDQGSKSGNKVGGFTEGQIITVIGDMVNGWYKVEGTDCFTGTAVNGYSSGDYIAFTIAASTAANISFNIRTTEPDKNDYHYYSNQNIYFASNYGMPNCTAYAWGRIWEIYGTKLPSGYFIHHAYSWWDDNIQSGKYKYGSEPRVGAIAVWASDLPKSKGSGHVAVVEKIENGITYVSESYYSSTIFKYDKIVSTGYLRGYIYVDQPNY